MPSVCLLLKRCMVRHEFQHTSFGHLRQEESVVLEKHRHQFLNSSLVLAILRRDATSNATHLC